jgi:hypothetical protein
MAGKRTVGGRALYREIESMLTSHLSADRLPKPEAFSYSMVTRGSESTLFPTTPIPILLLFRWVLAKDGSHCSTFKRDEHHIDSEIITLRHRDFRVSKPNRLHHAHRVFKVPLDSRE